MHVLGLEVRDELRGKDDMIHIYVRATIHDEYMT